MYLTPNDDFMHVYLTNKGEVDDNQAATTFRVFRDKFQNEVKTLAAEEQAGQRPGFK